MPRLNLVVLRARDASRLASFYSQLGLEFVLHRHGSGPEHFASENEGGVFEIYPIRKNDQPTSELRLGFEVNDIRQTLSELRKTGAEILSEPVDSPWGVRAVIRDYEGNKVELTEAGSRSTVAG